MSNSAQQRRPGTDLACEREAIRRELLALSLRAREAGLTSACLVINLLIAHCMEDTWPREI